MAFDSSDSRRAAEFDSFRRELVMHSRTVSGEAREAWFARLKELVEALFPDSEVNFRKPGLATRLFSVEVSVPGQDKFHLMDMCSELDINWRASIKEDVKGGASCVYRDRLDAIWEWVADLGNCYVTGHVKLRNFNFDHKPNVPERKFGGPDQRRPDQHRPDRGFRDRPYQDRKWEDRPSRPPNDRPRYDRSSSDRPQYDRPSGDRPQFDRPQGDRPPRKSFGPGGKPPFGGGRPRKFGSGPNRRRPNDRH